MRHSDNNDKMSSTDKMVRSSRVASVVTMVFECYALYRYSLHYNVLLDVSFTRSKRVNKKTILHYTSSRTISFHAKFQAQCLHSFPVLT